MRAGHTDGSNRWQRRGLGVHEKRQTAVLQDETSNSVIPRRNLPQRHW
jgi:hypothetical protein